MKRAEKEQLVTELRDKLTAAQSLYYTDFTGLNVKPVPNFLSIHGIDDDTVTLKRCERSLPLFAKLKDWQQFWSTGKAKSIEGNPIFQGGDLLAQLKDGSQELQPADFRLADGSPGKGNDCADLHAPAHGVDERCLGDPHDFGTDGTADTVPYCHRRPNRRLGRIEGCRRKGR